MEGSNTAVRGQPAMGFLGTLETSAKMSITVVPFFLFVFWGLDVFLSSLNVVY